MMMSGGAHEEEIQTTIFARHLHPLFVPPLPTTRSGGHSPSSFSPSRPPTPPPPRRKRRPAHGAPPTPVLPFEAQTVVLVRDPPKDHLSRSKESLAEDEEPPLARVAGKGEIRFDHNYPSLDLNSTTAATAAPTTAKATRSSLTATASEDFADLYEYYYDDAAEDFVFPTPKPSKPLPLSVIHVDHAHPNPNPNPHPNPSNRPPTRVTKSKSVKDTTSKSIDPAMTKKRRGSLQAIFVPSFLQSSGTSISTTSVPSSPTSNKYASNGQGRARGLSGAAPSAPATPSAGSNAFPPRSPSFSQTLDVSISLMPTSNPASPTTPVNALPPMIPMPEEHQRNRSITFNMSSFSSPRSSPPPDFLLDDDPFANLSGPPIDRVAAAPHAAASVTRLGPGPSQVPLPLTPVDASTSVISPVTPISPPLLPRSPLHESPPPKLASLDAAALASVSGPSLASPPTSTSVATSASGTLISAPTSGSGSTSPIISASASASTAHPRPPHPHLAPLAPSSPPAGRGSPNLPPRTRPAYQRPAFSSRPSLPSLDTLARMNVVLTKKVRKGRVGAGLPFEPWDLPSDEELPSAPRTRPHTPTRVHSASPSLSLSLSTGALPTTGTTATPTANTSGSVPLPSSEAGNGEISRPLSPTVPTTPTPSASVPMPAADGAPISPSMGVPAAQVARPQLLLPSQIMALGSVAEDVEMIMPINSRPVSTATTISSPVVVPAAGDSDAAINPPIGTTHPWLVEPLSSPITGDFAADFAEEVEAELDFVSSRPSSLDGKTGQEVAGSGGYLGGLGPDYLERYLAESRAGSEDGHGVPAGVVNETRNLNEDEGVRELPVQPAETEVYTQKDGDVPGAADSNDDDSYLYRRPLDFDDMFGREDASTSASTSTFNSILSGVPSGSMIFSSPPSFFTSPPSLSSSMSLSRSVSSTSYSSMDSAESADSVGAVESAEVNADERESRGGTWRRNHRFGGQNPSLSSLELDLEGNDSTDGPSSEIDRDREERDLSTGHAYSTSTRSSSSHPSLSRTRSSSEDSSDVLHSPLQGDYSYFPYERAREVYQHQQQALLGQPHHPYSASALFGALDGEGLGDGVDETERRMLSEPAMSFGQRSLSTSSGRRDHDEEVSEEFALSALSGEGLSFGFGYHKLGLPETVAAEVGVEDEKMNISLGHATTTTNVTTSTEKLGSSTSSFDEHNHNHLVAPASTTTSRPVSAVDEHVDHNPGHFQHSGSPNSGIPLSSPTQPSPVRPSPTNLVLQAISSPLPLPDHSPSEDMTSSSSPSSLMLRTSPKTVVSPRITGFDVDVTLSSGSTSTTSPSDGEMRDSSGQNGQRSRGHSAATTSAYKGGSSHEQASNGNGSAYASAYSSSSAVMRSNRGHRRNNGDDEDEEEERRRRRVVQKMQHMNDATIRLKPKQAPSSSSSEDEDGGTDDYGEPSAPATNSYLSVPRHAKSISRSPSSGDSFVTASSSPSFQPMEFPSASSGSSRYASEDDRDDDEAPEGEDDEDDDVPLAQRIPSALTAQKSIRRQFRQEREQRKREKAMRVPNESQAERRVRQVTLRPAGAGNGSGMNVMGGSSSQDAALLAAAAAAAAAAATTAPQPQARQRTLTLPGKPATPVHPAFDPYDLTRKLQNAQLSEKPMSPVYQQHVLPTVPPQQLQHLGLSHGRSKSISRPSVDQQRQQQITSPTTSSNPLSSTSASTSPPTVLRSKTVRDPNSTSHLRHPPSSPPPPAPVKVPSLRPMRSFHHSDGRPSLSSDGDQRLGRSATTSGRTSNEQRGHGRQRSASRSRVSGERLIEERPPPLPTSVNLNLRQSTEEQRKLVMSPTSPDVRLHSTRTSEELEKLRRPSTASQQPPQLPQPASKAAVFHQRVFVGNLQQFYMVEIGASTTAGDVISMMDAQGALTGWAGSGGWMVFEVAQDFGMERPVRSYELLTDIQSSWLKDKTVNLFVLKRTSLATPLSRSAIPSSSPTHSGYVEWETKRGKWSKRWLQLREHSLWLSKRDNRKDEILLCSLSNFDVYHITRNHKSPKPFSFAIKSTDNLSFFENTDDYMHTFSCSEKDGNVWLEKILIARSYVLYQERHVLFSPKSSSDNTSSTLTRSGTKKYAANSRPAHPHVALPPLLAPKSLTNNDVFEPGSLLAKQL